MKDELLFEDNFFVSKSMKQIDSSVGYKNEMEQRLVKNLIDCNKDKSKDFFIIENDDKKLKKRKKDEEIRKRENSKNNTHQLNLISSPYNLYFLPRISPYIKNIDNYLIMDNKKADKLGSKGFEYIWKQEHLRKLSNIKTNGFSNKNRKAKSKSRKKENINFINDDDDEEQQDIFNAKYKGEDKKCDEYIKLKERLNRIINGNKKVKKIFDLQKAISLKFKTKKIYYPRYESIEKHKPEIRLNNKTRRIFPDNFVKKSYYSETNNKLFSTTLINNKKTKGKKFYNTITPDKRKTFYICSSLSFDNIFSQNNNTYETNNLIEGKNHMKYTNINLIKSKGNLTSLKN